MKKLLALVLALVMTLSLCVVSSNAKFDDAADISYAEAADVMQAVGVFVGDGSGNFYPTQNLTRAQAAKVIAYLDLGESVAESLPAVQMFSDVPATHWAAKYIAYCADAEIVAGVGGGKFDPEAQVTGYQFAKMLLVVLGYDVEIEKLTGMNWSISTAKLAKADKLAKGFKGSLNDGLTREGAAQLAFRAIQAIPVSTYTGYGLKLGANNEIVNQKSGEATKAKYTLAWKLWHDNDSEKDDERMKLKTGDLTKGDANDNFENPAHKWVWKNAKVGTYTDEAVLTYTTEWTWAQAKEDLAELGVQIDTVANNYDVPVDVYQNAECTTYYPVYKKDVKATENNMKQAIKDNEKQGGNGIVTKFYANSDDYLDCVTEAVYVLSEVIDISKDLASTKLVNEAKLYFTKAEVTVADATKNVDVYADEDTIGFGDVYADAEKGDKLLIAVQPVLEEVQKEKQTVSYYVLGVAAPVVKEGKLTSNGTKSCKLDGELYNKAYVATKSGYDFGTIDTTNTVKLYCDEYGYAYGTGETTTSSKLVVVTDVYLSLEKGKMSTMADVVYADGTTGSVKIAAGDKVSANSAKIAGVYRCEEDTKTSGLYEMKTCDSSKIQNVAANTKIKAGSLKIDGKYCTDDVKTIFFYETSTGTVKTVVVDGVAEIKGKATVYYDTNNKTEVNAIFVGQKPANTVSGTSGIVMIAGYTDQFETLDKDGDKVKVRAYTAYVDGEELDEFYVINGGTTTGFFDLEKDIDLENGYTLLGNRYDDTDEDVQEVRESIKLGALDHTDVIEFAKDETVKVNSSTVFVDVCDTDGYTVENLNSLSDALRTINTKNNNTKATADVAVLYDDDTGVALYVYVGEVKAN